MPDLTPSDPGSPDPHDPRGPTEADQTPRGAPSTEHGHEPSEADLRAAVALLGERGRLGPGLLEQSVGRGRRLRGQRLVGAATALVLLAGGAVGVGVAVDRSAGPRDGAVTTSSGPRPSPGSANPGSTDTRRPAPGMRLTSAYGVELEVPARWGDSLVHCGTPIADTVLHPGGVTPACAILRDPTVQSVEISGYDPAAPDDPGAMRASSGIPFALDGHTGDLSVDSGPQGRSGYRLAFPDDRVAVRVVTPDEGLARTMLASVRFVDVDHNGCASVQPSAPALTDTAPGPDGLVAGTPTSGAFCWYGSATDPTSTQGPPRLGLSQPLTGDDLQAVLRALAAAPGGRNPPPVGLCPADPPGVAQQLRLVQAAGSVQVLAVRDNGCTGLGVTDGRVTQQVTLSLLKALYGPAGMGFSVPSPIPD